MKKFVIFTLIIAMVAGAAFAQFANGMNANAWGRAAFSPLRSIGAHQTDGKTDDGAEAINTTGIGASWGGDKVRVDFRIHGGTDYVGFTIASNADDGGIGTGDDGYHIWVKPFGNDLLKLTAGAFVNDTLRGKVGNLDGGFSNFVLRGSAPDGNVPEEDPIFNRFGTHGGVNSTYVDGANGGFLLSSAPVEGLFLGLMVVGQLDPWWNNAEGGTLAKDAYRYMQIGAGYNIDGIGHIRAQWIGGYLGSGSADSAEDDFVDPSKPARIEAAFALTAVQNLLVDLGFKFWLPVEIEDGPKASKGINASVGANFRAEAFSIGARVDSGFGSYARAPENDDSGSGIDIAVRLSPAYDLDFATLGLSLGMRLVTASKDANGDALEDNWTQFGFGAFIAKGLASGSIKAGLSYTLPPSYKDGATGSGVFQIPIILEYAFF
jgi:hypothetical protein